MNFTREPIIETIISPKEGCKLLIRNSKGENFEEYYVDAVEVVSFGRAFFFRSMERPKSFLVPVSDYEIVEVKEARVALKNASHEKSIKIGGGREAHVRQQQQREPREQPQQQPSAETESVEAPEETALETAVESRMDRKRDRRRHRRRRGGHEERESEHKHREPRESREQHEGGAKAEFSEEEKGPSLFSTLIPPPPTLISETLSRYREKEAEPKENGESENKHQPPVEPRNEEQKEDEPGADSSALYRTVVKETVQETSAFSSTYYIPLGSDNDPFF